MSSAPVNFDSPGKPVKLAALLSENYICCDLKASTRAELIAELLRCLQAGHSWLDIESAQAAVTEREELFPTVIAPGLAVPHARMPGLNTPLIAIGVSRAGIDFGIPETATERVHMAVLLLTPESNPGLHLQILSALAVAFRTPELLTEVLKQRTAAELRTLLSGGDESVPDYLTVEDLMDGRFTALLETDTLRRAIHLLATSGESELPVIDDDGELRGLLSTRDLLKLSLPPHLLWMENLSPINRFQPFADMLKSAGDTRLADVMREEFISVRPDLPAIQLAKLFLVNQVSRIAVTDQDNKLVGMVRLADFCAKLFWE